MLRCKCDTRGGGDVCSHVLLGVSARVCVFMYVCWSVGDAVPVYTQKRPTYKQKKTKDMPERPINTQSRPVYTQKSPTYTQKRPI